MATMTVKELKDRLSRFEDDDEVYLHGDFGMGAALFVTDEIIMEDE